MDQDYSYRVMKWESGSLLFDIVVALFGHCFNRFYSAVSIISACYFGLLYRQ